MNVKKILNERRRYPRYEYDKPVLFTMQRNQNKDIFYEGKISNIGFNGVFILTANSINVGEKIKLIVPYVPTSRPLPRIGEVIRVTKDGFALEFRRVET